MNLEICERSSFLIIRKRWIKFLTRVFDIWINVTGDHPSGLSWKSPYWVLWFPKIWISIFGNIVDHHVEFVITYVLAHVPSCIIFIWINVVAVVLLAKCRPISIVAKGLFLADLKIMYILIFKHKNTLIALLILRRTWKTYLFCSIFDFGQYFNFWQNCKFWKKFEFLAKFEFLTIFEFLTKCRFLTKVFVFDKISIFDKF